MDWHKLLDPDIQDFILENRFSDVRDLALKKPPSVEWPYPVIIDQIKTRQKALIKAPEFLSIKGFLFPPGEIFEQASSQACASYKARQVVGDHLLDLTGGCGIDAFYMGRSFLQVNIVEQDHTAASLLRHNSKVLIECGFLNPKTTVHEARADEFLNQGGQYDLIYIDPERRALGRKGFYDLSKCSPNVLQIMPDLQRCGQKLWIKTSPILDIQAGIETFEFVSKVIVLGWKNECKEVLYCIDLKKEKNNNDILIEVAETNLDGGNDAYFSFRYEEEKNSKVVYCFPRKFIYEPAPAFMKAGGFKTMAQRFGLAKLHPLTHLYTSDEYVKGFVGKAYLLDKVANVGAKEIGLMRAELSLRNFSGTSEALRKKLKIKEGSEYRIFATTLYDGSKKLLICQKF